MSLEARDRGIECNYPAGKAENLSLPSPTDILPMPRLINLMQEASDDTAKGKGGDRMLEERAMNLKTA